MAEMWQKWCSFVRLLIYSCEIWIYEHYKKNSKRSMDGRRNGFISLRAG